MAEYKLICSNDEARFCRYINAALDDGFRFMPSGLMITPNSVSNRLEYTREMIKYDDHEDVEDWPEIRL